MRLLSLVLLLFPAAVQAGDMPAAKLRTPVGTLLQRGAKGWTAPMLFDSVPAGVELVALPGAKAVLEVKEGDLRLILAGNLPELSPTPVLESAVKLRKADKHDLEFSLERGRVLIENHMDKGPVKVRAHMHGKTLDFELADKKSVVALELFSRWPAGAPFLKKPKAGHEPIGELIFLALQGKSAIEVNNVRQPLQAPMLYRFTTLREIEGPTPLKKLPDWAKPGTKPSPRRVGLEAALEKLRRAVADKGVGPGIAAAVESGDAATREVTAYAGAALDVLAAGIKALKDEKSKDVRSAGVHALHHYVGRGSAEDVRLFETLVADNVKAGQAGIILELLHGFGAEARQRPETYDALIAYLQSDQIAIRELAAWSLARLAPKGRDIAFDAAAAPEQRAQAQAAWRQLIPEGAVPK